MGTEIQKALLQKGYFPRELPPAFTTDDFGAHSDDIIAEWGSSGVFSRNTRSLRKTPSGKKRRGVYTYNLFAAEAEIISKPKRGYERRTIHITHPVPQALLAAEMSENWKSIQTWLSRQTYSEDAIRVSSQYERSIKGINFALHNTKTSYLEATADWLVKTDISRFYPSIYTHSIAWAAYGKEKVKRNIYLYQGSLADRLDFLIRACSRNQTIGIPIGPETSRIVAEVISSRIDSEFANSIPNIRAENVDRLQDDWTIGVESLERAERVLYRISRLYQSYGLDINGSKTSIDSIIAERPVAWISEIRTFLSHRRGALRRDRLKEFLDLCLRLQAQYRAEPVINYALSVIERSHVSQADIATMESFLLEAAVVAPISMDRICRIILNLQHMTTSVSTKRIGERFTRLTELALEKGHTYEVVWLLYTLRGLGRPVDLTNICKMVDEVQSSAIALLLLDMKNKRTLVGTLPIATWESRISEDSVQTDWTWLLAYEAFRKGWLNDRQGLMKNDLFKPMDTRNVVFFNPDKNIKTSKSHVAALRKLRRLERLEVKMMMKALRGMEWDDY